jgi:hypothetical protein
MQFRVGELQGMGVFTMCMRKAAVTGLRILAVAVMSMVLLAWTQDGIPSQRFGFGTAPSNEEIKAADIAVASDGEGLPPGKGYRRMSKNAAQ